MSANWLRWVITPLVLVTAPIAVAQTYPDRPVRLVVPFPPSGPADIMGRAVAAHLWPGGSPQVIVENRPGAGGTIGVDAVAKSPPNGYTMAISIVKTLAVNASLYKKLPYDPVRDLAPVIIVGSTPGVIVIHPALPANNVKDILALARKHPGELNYGSGGVGTSAHFSGELFRYRTGVEIAHVPYKGNALAMQDLVGGRLHLMFDYLPASLPFIQSGRVRALAVGSDKRSPHLPQVPTVLESGVKDYVMVGHFAIFVAAATPPEIVQKLNLDMGTMLRRAAYRESLVSQGADVPAPQSPAEVTAMLKSDLITATRVIAQSGLRVD